LDSAPSRSRQVTNQWTAAASMASPQNARTASAAVRQAGASAIQLTPAPSAQPAAASTMTIVNAAMFQAMAEPILPN
jgi:hypothetical protein